MVIVHIMVPLCRHENQVQFVTLLLATHPPSKTVERYVYGISMGGSLHPDDMYTHPTLLPGLLVMLSVSVIVSLTGRRRPGCSIGGAPLVQGLLPREAGPAGAGPDV